ncbi:MAG: ATP-binding protein [Bacteroidia bacterium]|nr:ATP-binding protein [Bacteroidia bacterium]MDW8235356.1 ATP-binding protein [Bacteroidia bacterium]
MRGWDTSPLLARIAAGEGTQLDFKQRIDSARKIARTLSAFANTEGGSLLIGVKDNGRICGIDPEQEYYMIELAASRYMRPMPSFSVQVHLWEERQILEVVVPVQRELRPFFVREEDDSFRAYVRVGDQSRVAGPLLEALWREEKNPQHVFFRREESRLMEYLKKHSFIDEPTYRRLLGRGAAWKAQRILIKYTLIGLLRMEILPEGEIFHRVGEELTIQPR